MGNEISNAAVVRRYPQNPPACTQCPPGQPPNAYGGFIETPSNETCIAYFGEGGCTPLVQGASSPVFIVLYCVWGLTLSAALYWAVYKWLISNDARDTGSPRASISEYQILDERCDDEKVDGYGSITAKKKQFFLLQFFRYSMAEKVATFLIVINGVILLAYWLVLTLDFYLECDFPLGSVDSACFFGTFRIFGNYENNAKSFFLVWGMLVFYSLILAFHLQDVLDWVKIPSSPVTASFVQVWVKEDAHILTSGRPTWAMRIKLWIQRCWIVIGELLSHLLSCGRKTSLFHSSKRRRVTLPILTTPMGMRYFVYECVRYSVPDGEQISLTLDNTSIQRILELYKSNGLDQASRLAMTDRCGKNSIPIELPSILQMFRDEFITPFYAYQITVYLIWIWWTYWIVGVWLLLIVILSGCWSVKVKRASLRSIHALADQQGGVYVLRNNSLVYCNDSRDLVCGDVVKVAGDNRFWDVPADLVLVSGTCATDESGLTGESMPKAKTSISNYPLSEHHVSISTSDVRFKAHILFAGTTVLEASADAMAVVIAVGTDSTRGQILSHVLFPVETKFRFDEEFGVAVGFMFIYALAAFVLSIKFQNDNGSQTEWPTILSYAVFTISQIVSPMLKIALVAGRVAATTRLKNKEIVCVDAQRIDIAGKVRAFCFDKTGTITKDGLVFAGYMPLEASELYDDLSKFPEACRVAATCHSLGSFDGQLLGSSVEVAMFNATQRWKFDSKAASLFDNSGTLIASLLFRRRLAFDQEKRLMSVIVENESCKKLTLYIKGAPESIAERCNPKVPPSFLQRAEKLAAEGYYVLGIAERRVEKLDGILDESREVLEKDLKCLGLLVFSNELKPDAHFAMQELKEGHIRCIMVTGDNVPCGCFVARECGMIDNSNQLIAVASIGNTGEIQWSAFDPTGGDLIKWSSSTELLVDQRYQNCKIELAVNGDAFSVMLKSGEIYRVLPRIRVFARMSPAQKVQVVHALMDGPEGVVVAFAGDGANDAGALRAAHVGLSMSAAQASVVAPFTSSSQAVASCVDLITEGRAALATSLASYKLLVVYGLVFSIVKMVSFYYGVLMPILGYILIDVLSLVPITFLMTLSKPLPRLGPQRPTSSLMGGHTVGSVVGFLVVFMCTIAINLTVMSKHPDYVRWPSTVANTAAWWYISDNWEATVLWQTAFMLFISCAIVFSFGSGFRANVLKNYLLVIYVFGLFFTASLLLLLPANQFSVQFHIATEQFNRNGTSNPIWRQYQINGGDPSPAMSLTLRITIWSVSVLAIIAISLWERYVIYGSVGMILKAYWQGTKGERVQRAREFDLF